MDRVTRLRRRVLTPVGALVGLAVGIMVFQRMIRDKAGILEAGDFVIAVMAGGIIAMILYTGIKEGGSALLRRGIAAEGVTTEYEPASAPKPAAEPEPEPARKEPLKAAKTAETAKKAPLKAKKAPLKAAARERPLRPRD